MNLHLKIIIKYLKIFSVALFSLIIIFSAFLYFNFYLPQGKGPAGQQVPADPFKNVWKEQTVLLLGIGDSITDGFGAPTGFSYFDRLLKNPPGDSCDMQGKNLSIVFPNLISKNIAVSHTVSKQHIKAIEKFSPQSPDIFGIIVITTGGNDLIHSYGRAAPKECAMYGASLQQAKPWIENFKLRLDQMVMDVNEKFPGGCEIFLANIYDPSDDTGNTNELFTGLPNWPDGLLILAEYNKIISDCADKFKNVHLVNIYTPFLGHGINCNKFWLKNYQSDDPYYWYYMNIEDHNPRGYYAIRRLFLNEMIKIFVP
ncbi:MAG: SGNH/GDSL hydrolase family protein [Phycisphaerales bacterium]